MSDEELKVQDAIVNSLIKHYKAVIEQYKVENSEDKIIRRTLENFMRGLWAEIQVCEMEYTTSEIYEMLLKEIFTDNHVDIPSAESKTDILDKLKAELHATAEMYDDGDYYLRDEWIDEYFDKYKAEIEPQERKRMND